MIKSTLLAFAAMVLCIALTGTHAAPTYAHSHACKCSVKGRYSPDRRDIACVAKNGAQAWIQAEGLKDKPDYPLKVCVARILATGHRDCDNCTGGDVAVKCSQRMKQHIEGSCHA